MKRILVPILMMLYMAGAMGATVHLHYCMGEFVGVSLIHHEEHKCSKCGMVKKTMNNGCCQDEHITFKTAEHNKVTASFSFSNQSIAIASDGVFYAAYKPHNYNGALLPVSRLYSPPDTQPAIPIYLQIRNLRV